MNVVIYGEGGRVGAYSADLLAGVAGFDVAQEFIDAARSDQTLLPRMTKLCDPFDVEDGEIPVAKARLHQRLQQGGYDVLQSPQEDLAESAKVRFGESYLAAMGAVLLQANANQALRAKLTAAAVTLASAAALTLSSGGMVNAHAGEMSRLTKDILGASIGGALGNQIGDGRGRKVATVVGAIVGLGVAEAQHQQRERERTKVTPAQLSGPAPVLPTGTVELSLDRREKLQALQEAFIDSRGAYAGALYMQLQAQDDATLSPRDGGAARAFAEAARVADERMQGYGQRRAEFANAVEFLAKRGYDMRDFAYSHTMAYSPVTARDVPRAAVRMAHPEQMRPVAASYQYTP